MTISTFVKVCNFVVDALDSQFIFGLNLPNMIEVREIRSLPCIIIVPLQLSNYIDSHIEIFTSVFLLEKF